MSIIVSHAGGRQAAKHILRNSAPNLARFNVEPSKLYSFGLCTSLRSQNSSTSSKLFSFYHAASMPITGGLLAGSSSPSFRFSLAYFNQVAKKNPWLVGFCTACTKAVLADILAQKIVEKKEKLDLRRTALFFGFGAIYSGIICNILYTTVYPLIFRSRYLKLNAIGAAFTDNFINTPFVMMPILYTMKECFLFPGGSMRSAFEKYKAEIFEVSVTAWKIWLPAHMITFSYVPSHLRMPYVSAVSFVFFLVVSTQQASLDLRRQSKQLQEVS